VSLIFISHSSKDNAAAEELRDRLQQQGYSSEGSIFLDFDSADGIKAGQGWEQALYRNIRACRAVIVLCSKDSMDSRWCFMEITHARALGKQLFPVKIDDCDVGGILSDHQMVDLSKNKEEAYRSLFHGIVDAGLDPSNIFLWDGKRSPYPGLMAFQEADAAVFFGREDEVAEGLDLLNRVQRLGEAGLVMMLGASGSGKSSVVRAGIVPRLRRDVERWLVVDPFRPRNDPGLELAEVLSRAFARAGVPTSPASITEKIREMATADVIVEEHGGPGPAPGAKNDDVLERLRNLEGSLPDGPEMESVRRHLRLARMGLEHPEGANLSMPSSTSGAATNALLDLISDLLRASGHENAKVLLIIDQFEELLDHQSDHPANSFLRLLCACMQQPIGPLLLVGTMRSDFLGSFQKCPALVGLRYESFPLGPMRNLTPVITEPARAAGIELESGLVEALVADAKTEDALPLLAFALRELYDRVGERNKLVRVKDYDDLGRLEGAVARSAGQLVTSLEESQRGLLRRAFLSLARITDDGNYARRTVPWSDLDTNVHPILEKFVESRLLVSGERGGERVLEVAHEALFRSWDMLKSWLRESAEALRLRKDIEDIAGAWENSARSDEYLWRGGRLARSLELGKAGSLQLKALEGEFLQASEQAEEAEKRREEARRKRQLRWVLVFAGVLCSLLIGVVFLYWDSTRQRNQALARQLASESGLVWGATHNGTVAALLGIESLRRAETAQGYEALWGASAGMGRAVSRLTHQDRVNALAFSPDGTLVATASSDKTARVFEARTGNDVFRLQHQGGVYAVAFSPDSALLATESSGGTEGSSTSVFDTRTGHKVVQFPHRTQVIAVAFIDASLVVAVSRERIAVLEVRTGHEVVKIDGTSWNIRGVVAISPDGTLVAMASLEDVRVFEALTGREVVRLEHPEVRMMAFSPNGNQIASASYRTSRVFEVRTRSQITRIEDPDTVNGLAFSRDGTLLATALNDKTARVFEVRTGQEIARLKHPDRVTAVVFSPDGTLLASASSGKTALVFEVRTGREVTRLEHQDLLTAVEFSPDGTLVATASGNVGGLPSTVHVFEGRTGRDVAQQLQVGEDKVAFSPGGMLVAAASDQTIRLIEARTGHEVARLEHVNEDGQRVSAMALSPDGTLLALGSSNHRIGIARVFEALTGRELARLESRAEGVNEVEAGIDAVAFSPDGSLLAAGLGSKPVVFEARNGREVARLGRTFHVTAMAFSADGARIAMGNWDNDGTSIAQVFETRTGRELARLEHLDPLTAVAFSPDGTLVAVGSLHETTRVFQASTGHEVARLKHQYPVIAVAFSPDSRLVGTGTGSAQNGSAQVFEAGTGRELARLALGVPVRYVDFLPGGRSLRAVSGTTDLRITQDLVAVSDLISRACSDLDRNLTREEWATYFGELRYRETCPQLDHGLQ
jgi:WD40 repeat protein